jgi:glycosyltransferase involved in cell wall biosynthesis
VASNRNEMMMMALAPSTHASSDRRALVWVFGELDKRGSFEDYVVRLAERSHEAGLALDIVAGPGCAAGLREELASRGARLSCVAVAERDSMRHFIREMRRVRPVLVHCHFGSPSTILAPLARLMGAKRFVVTDHGSRTVIERPAGRVQTLRLLRRRVQAAFIDLWLPVSSFVGEMVINEVGAPRERVCTLFNGIDLTRANRAAAEGKSAIRERVGLPQSARIALFVGNLMAEKGVADLIEMQYAILGSDPDRMIVWVGDGPLRPVVDAHAGDRIRVLGRRSDVPDLVHACDVLLAPSRWHEAFSLALAEAAAGGIPAVATRVGGIPEVVLDGETGLLVPMGDREAFVASAVRLLADAPLADRLGRNARRRSESAFSLDRMISHTLDDYRKLLAGMQDAIPASHVIRSA